MTTTVYVVAFESEGSGGFYWFPKKADAEKAFIEDKNNVQEFKSERWRTALFPHETAETDKNKITREIDEWIWAHEWDTIQAKSLCYA